MALPIFATFFDRQGGTYNPFMEVRDGNHFSANAKTLTVNVWFEPQGWFSGARLMRQPGGGLTTQVSNGTLRIRLENTAGADVFKMDTNDSVNDNEWNHLAYSLNMANQADSWVALNGIRQTGFDIFTDDEIELQRSGGHWSLMGTASSYPGCCSEWLIHDAFVPWDNGNGLAKFYVATGPKAADMGDNGELPFGEQPVIYLAGQYPNHLVNFGSGGDATALTVSQHSECGTAPERDSGVVPPSKIEADPTYNEFQMRFVALPGDVAVLDGFTNTFQTQEATGHVFDSPTGEVETLIWEDGYDWCNFGTIPAETTSNTLFCDNFAVGSTTTGTIERIETAPGSAFARCNHTKAAVQQTGLDHTDMYAKVPGWSWNGRRMNYRQHYRFKMRVRLREDFDIPSAGWNLVAQVKWGNISGGLNAPGGGNPSVAIMAGDDSQTRYDIELRGSPHQGGPAEQGKFPDGVNIHIFGGDYSQDYMVWRDWVIDYFNPADPDGPDPSPATDGFFKFTIDGQVIADYHGLVGLWYNDSDNHGCESFYFGPYVFLNEFGDRDAAIVDFADVRYYEVTPGTAPNPRAVFENTFETAEASGDVRSPVIGNAVIHSSMLW